jgi:ATP-binding cassette subfamily C protein
MSTGSSIGSTTAPLWPERLLAHDKLQRRGGNQAIRLNDPARAWRICEGQIELFLVILNEDNQESARHHLASVVEGGLLLGIPAESEVDFVLLAVPHADTLLQELELTALVAESVADDLRPPLAAALEIWLRALSAGMARWASPRPAIGFGIGIGETLVVPAQRRCSGQRDIAWVRLAPESAIFIDIQDLPASDGELCFPLAPESWLLTNCELSLQSCSTESALRNGDAWAGVATLHRILFETAEMNLRLANVDEFNRLKARRASTEADRDQAFKALMAITERQDQALIEPVKGDTPLVSALRLIGKDVGFKVRPPSGQENDQVPELERIALTSGLRMREVNLRQGWWQQDFGTLLAFDKVSGQALVLRCDGKGQPHLIDPTNGEKWDLLASAATRTRVAPTAYELSAPLPFRAIDFRELFAFALLRGWRDLMPMLLAGAIGGLIGIVTPVATAYIIDSVIPNHEAGHLIELGIVLTALSATAFVASYIGTIAFSRAESRMGRAVQSGMMDRVIRLPMCFFQNYSAGDLATRLMAITQIQNLVSSSSVNSILAGLFGLFSFALMFYYDARLALWASLLMAIYLLLSFFISYRRLLQERPLANLSGELNNTLLQLILGVTKIRLAAAEDRAFARWATLFAKSRLRQLASQRLAAAQTALNAILTLSGLLVFVLIIGKTGTNPDLLTLGAFAALLVAFQRFSAGLTMMMQVGTELLAIQPQLERSRPLLAAVPEIGEEKTYPGKLSGAIEISHLSFRYNPDGPLILDDISLEVAPGEFVALVGPSGSGKSTLLRVLLGFEEPQAGGILFDGQNLANLDAPALRRQMGVAMQNAQLMPRSLFDNIVATSGCSQEDAWEAATQVGLADDIRSMPMGMHTTILEGGGALSGGQMQRMMIARAIVGRPKILLLDEATSALDNRTQAVVTESLDRLRVTRLVVAHRLSTIVNADRIYVFENGRIVETGRFDDLMAAKGSFARLAERQMV